MSKHTYSITGTGRTSLGPWYKTRHEFLVRGSLDVYGTFGGTSLELQKSPDGGTTWIAIPDAAGDPVTFTAQGTINFEVFTDPNNPVLLALNATGGTGISITAVVWDER